MKVYSRVLLWACAFICLNAEAGSCSPGTLALDVRNAWIRLAPPSAMMWAGYASIGNGSKHTVTLLSASSPDFGMVEMHETTVVKGVASMHALDGVVLPHMKWTEFAPSGKHFMLMDGKRELKKGDRVTITLHDSRGCDKDVVFVVRAERPLFDKQK